MKFETFINSAWRNYWIKEGTLEIYVRKTPEGYKHRWGDYQLASMSNSKPGNGDLTRFLNKWEKHYQFYIENVLNDRLAKFLRKRQYRAVNAEICLPANPPCMMGPDPKMIADLFRIVNEYYNGDKDD